MAEQPEITQEMRDNAKAHPNSWLYVIDHEMDDGDQPSQAAIVGAYPVDERGEIEETFHGNPEYGRGRHARPAAPQRVDDLGRLLEEIRAGKHRPDVLPPVVLDTILLIYAAGRTDRSITAFPNRDGRLMVPACTSPDAIPRAWPGWRPVLGRELAPLLRGHPLVINPIGPVAAVIPAAHLIAAVTR
ncbi:type III secretion system (T3SS) SseB-like protein [Herbihabitans rhizosphaerae]|uniref:Type III secretion system (T3SS) SseB-like protein n=1 Tax=Herbihabitans rhizosphaerae TaxID=1872711 RepID=A0A4Q7KWC2_9PSEU|nr:type VII secretion system-associated protein [Herbihabitans rhizosphaerae]RZS41359.1 type III secretion system (T3SS) SseB-like protein [Herbihabitans rhizosphaerae]